MTNRSESADPRSARATEAVQPTASEAPPEATKVKTAQGLDVPLPTIGVRRVHISMPHVPPPPAAISGLAHAAAAVPRAVGSNLPPRGKLLYYAGLGALAAFEVVSWPVAAAIGTGVWVASRARPPAAGDRS